jgi:hypothetical protein
LVEMMRQVQSTHAEILYDRNGSVGCIVYNGQSVQRLPTGGLIKDKTHGPDFV